jgi:hypothetical protein
MSLPFEDPSKPKGRLWQCFVCGRNHNDFDEYKKHIIIEHDEGREYISCPDCQAPVRDMKVHYRMKHPKRTMPTNIQTRVGVWFDFKTGKDGKSKRSARKPTFRSGFFTSKKSGKDIPYRSGMECEFYECLEADMDVESFFAEPFKVPYYHKNEWHDYIPDLRINFIDGSTEIWEVKPANQTHYEQNKAKWAAMNDHAANYGWQFVVQTEVGLNKLKTKLKRQQGLLNEN